MIMIMTLLTIFNTICVIILLSSISLEIYETLSAFIKQKLSKLKGPKN